MIITLSGISKRFQKNNWIVKNFNYSFESGINYGISGANGSGKSTVLKIISGYLSPSKGTIKYHHHSADIKLDDLYKLVNIAAPYDGLIDEFTLPEMLDFHFKFKNWKNGWDSIKAIQFLNFEKHLEKQLGDFSSGMRQRVKLLLCLCSEGVLYLLDEPTSNLDEEGKAWYIDLVRKTQSEKQITIIASNEYKDFVDVHEMISIEDFSE